MRQAFDSHTLARTRRGPRFRPEQSSRPTVRERSGNDAIELGRLEIQLEPLDATVRLPQLPTETALRPIRGAEVVTAVTEIGLSAQGELVFYHQRPEEQDNRSVERPHKPGSGTNTFGRIRFDNRFFEPIIADQDVRRTERMPSVHDVVSCTHAVGPSCSARSSVFESLAPNEIS
jgi:hypothetical protein